MAKRLTFTSPAIQSDDALYHIKVTLIEGPMTEKYMRANPEPPSRVIAIKGSQTLEDLHYAIFEAFDRFDPHMYEFQFGAKKPMARAATRYGIVSDDEIGPFWDPELKDASAATIASMELKINEPFFYWFDFGDDWMHELRLVATNQTSDALSYPIVIRKDGESPPQYPDYESEEDLESAKEGREELSQNQGRVDEINKLVSDFCNAHLNADYADASERVFRALRSSWLDWRRGSAAGWAAGVAHATGTINFLHSREREPNMKLADIACYFDVSKSTMENRSRQIRDALNALPLDPRFCIPENLRDNPLAKLARIADDALERLSKPPRRGMGKNAPSEENKRAKSAPKRGKPKKA